jgi:hypothetical protein
MIIAELHGKMPSKFEDKEDLLTSNVFSFFKYTDRIYFKEYLSALGISVSIDESRNAEFQFWPSYEDNTEPDLVVICGDYYLLFEAKLYSDFSPKTKYTEAQIDREIYMGKMSSKNLNKQFVYIALTAEYFYKKLKYIKYENQDFRFIWTNWQAIAKFINEKIEHDNLSNDFALDLFFLLVKKRLRSFNGIKSIHFNRLSFSNSPIFYNLKTSKFKGEFSGYNEVLSNFPTINQYRQFFKKSFYLFPNLNKFEFEKPIFYRYEGKKYD